MVIIKSRISEYRLLLFLAAVEIETPCNIKHSQELALALRSNLMRTFHLFAMNTWKSFNNLLFITTVGKELGGVERSDLFVSQKL